jgi:hypothetical protein
MVIRRNAESRELKECALVRAPCAVVIGSTALSNDAYPYARCVAGELEQMLADARLQLDMRQKELEVARLKLERHAPAVS